MFSLTQKSNRTLKHKGVTINLKLFFNNVLLAYELIEDDFFNNTEKTLMLFNLLCKAQKKMFFLTEKINIKEKYEILEIIFSKIINKEKKHTTQEKQTFSFKYDAEEIYSSFMHQYGIDLFKMHDKLWWDEFIILFMGLDSNTAIKRLIEIRTKPVPKITKHNREYVTAIQQAKARCALTNKMTTEEKQKIENNSKKQLFEIMQKFADMGNKIKYNK